jgi:hypothetical protein
MSEKSIDHLLQKLSLKVSDESTGKQLHGKVFAFKEEIDSTKFTIFKPISDCGYYGWNPMEHPAHIP